MSLRLIIEDFEGDRMVVPLPEDEGPVTLGRAVDNHVRLPERNVSRRHAELHRESDGWMLVDVDSYNGLRVNGELVERQCKLKRGDYITLADYQLMVGCESVPLEEDVAALASAVQQFKKPVDEEGLAGQEMLDLFAAGFSGGSGEAPAANPASSPYEPLDPPPATSSAKKMFWLMAGAAAISVAVAVFWRVGGGAAADAGVARAQDALAAAGIRPSEPKKVESPQGKAPGSTKAKPGPATSSATSSANRESESAVPSAKPTEPGSVQDPAADDGQAPLGTATSTGSPNETDVPPTGSSTPDPGGLPAGNTAEEARRNARRQAKRSAEQAKAWIKRARKAAMAGRHQEALTWARRSFRAQASQEALQVLGLSACKLSRRRQAEFALNRLRKSESRRILRNVCGAAGISL